MKSAGTIYLEEMLGVKQSSDSRPLISGILQTRDYLSFEIRSDIGDVLHTFQGAKLANRCLVGDHVYWKDDRCQLELRDEHPLLVGTIELTHSARYGFTSRKTPLYLFTPYDARYPQMIVGSNEKDKTKNRVGLVKFETWSETSLFPRGSLQVVLGRSGEIEVEKRAILHQVCPWSYPKMEFHPEPFRGSAQHLPRTHVMGYTFHIDPEGCRDVDDVITVMRVDDGLWKIVITISDVAHFVEDGSAVDIMASLRGQTIYGETGNVLHGMLPKEYAEEACSMLPGSIRYGISLEFLWDGSKMSDSRWFESTIVVDKSYTYEEFERENSTNQKIVRGVASYLAGEELLDSHEWVSQLMIYYNKEAGRKLKDAGIGILRRHSEVERDRVEWYRQHLPDWKFLAMNSAEYVLSEEKDTYHFGLDTDTYAHVSSPIRRYVDIVNQRALKWLIHTTVEQRQNGIFIVPVAMYVLNERDRMIKQFARDMIFLEAVERGRTRVKAIIVEKREERREDGWNGYRIRFYVPDWKKMISSSYKKVDEDHIWSKDEKMVHEIRVGLEYEIQCSVNWSSRNWKERLVIQWCESSSDL